MKNNYKNCIQNHIEIEKTKIQKITDNQWLVYSEENLIITENCNTEILKYTIHGTYIVTPGQQCETQIGEVIVATTTNTTVSSLQLPLIQMPDLQQDIQRRSKKVDLRNVDFSDVKEVLQSAKFSEIDDTTQTVTIEISIWTILEAQLETTSISSPQAKSPAGSSAGAAASASTAPGERTPTAHNKQLQNVKGQDHPPHPSMAFLQNRSISLVDMYIDNSEPSENVGQIHFSLEYDFQNTTLILRIIQGKELPAKDLSGTSDPYVRVTLLPDKKHRLETKIKRRTLNPRWNETFYFEGFPIQKLQSRVLHLHVFDYDRFSRDDSIGEVFLPLCQVDLSEKPSFWKALKPPAKDKCGELLTSLCYHPSNSVLTLTLLKARNLKAKDINGKSDPYVKVWLQFGDKRIEKRKTAIFKCTLNPVFNDSFSFNVPWEKIRECSLDVQVMDFDNIGRNELIGRILLAGKNGSGATETKHWQDMITKPRQTIVQWHRLKPE